MTFEHITSCIGQSAGDALSKLRTGPFELEQIGGAYPDDAMYLLGRRYGIELAVSADGRVSTIWLHSGRRGHKTYDGPFPPGVTFSSGRSEVRTALGSPSSQGAGFDDRYIGKQGPWDRWDRAKYLLHIQYGFDDDVIELITIMHPKWEPGMGSGLPKQKRWWQFWHGG